MASQDLVRELEMVRRKLDLMLAIDEVRDIRQDPTSMLAGVIDRVACDLDADVCLLWVLEEDEVSLALRAYCERGASREMAIPALQQLAVAAVAAGRAEITDDPTAIRAAGLEGERGSVAAIPILMGRTPLGGLVVGRSEGFDETDRELLDFIEGQLDSAVVQASRTNALDLRNRELETIYRVDAIRDRHLPFDEMLAAVLEEIRTVLGADTGYILLFDTTGRRLETRAESRSGMFGGEGAREAIERLADEAIRTARLVHAAEPESGVGSAMCVPLILGDEILGVFGVCTGQDREFDPSERRLLEAIASQVDTAIFEGLEQRKLRQVLGRSVDPRIMDRLLENPDVDFLKGERHVLTVLYADLRGSTRLAEQTEPELLVDFINDYLGTMSDVILRHEGTLDKFVGDEVMALFGAPFPQEDHAERAVRVGLAMQRAHEELLDRWKARDLMQCPLGVGIATGELIMGEMGSPQRTDFTVIGSAANLGARICSVAEGGQVLISPNTWAAVQGRVEARPLPGLAFKGFSQEMTVYQVLGLATPG